MVILVITIMNGKSVPSEFPRTTTFASRLRAFVFSRRVKVCLWGLGLFFILLFCGFIELETSVLQSWLFTSTNERLYFELGDGPSKEIAFPRAGPIDERREIGRASCRERV